MYKFLSYIHYQMNDRKPNIAINLPVADNFSNVFSKCYLMHH